MKALLQFWIDHRAETLLLLRQHLVLVIVSTIVAVAVGVPAGVLASRRPRLGRVVLFMANVAQTIPSLALLGFLLPLPFIGGIGPRTALVTLTLYALLPIIRNTVSGLNGVDRSVVESGTALGMTPRQLFFVVSLPLALPTIVGGIRVATVIGVGTAAVAAAIGAGGLGEFIFRGLAMVDSTAILAGAVPAALMAISLDAGLAALERRLARRERLSPHVAVIVAVLLATTVVVAAWPGRAPSVAPVVVGSKNFTEQLVLGEVVAQVLEAEGLPVSRKLNLGGTFICDQALRAGGIDVYIEYTGTAVTAVFKNPPPRDSADALAQTRRLYAPLGITMTEPLGFNNTFAMLVRADDAASLGLKTIDDLSRVTDRFTPGFGHEFIQRADGFPGLASRYGLTFAHQPRAMELSLIYRALADRQVDLIAGDATSALIDSLHFTMLEDARHYFPPYDAVPLVRASALARHPEIAHALARLDGRVNERVMRAMNKAVDIDHQSPHEVAARFVSTLPPK